jgi:hypothetical protein
LKKTVHFSVDDVGLRLHEANDCAGLFDVPFFAKLKEWHEEFGLRVTCYCFAMTDNRLISELSDRLAPDFRRNRGWLKFGFHAKRDLALAEESGYAAGFELVDKTMRRLGAGRTNTLRCHCWEATPEQKRFLRSKGIKTLLERDSDDLPYGEDDTFTEYGLLHRRTRVRFEEIERIGEDTLHIGRTHTVAFTHEWCFDEQIPKIQEALRLYADAGCGFVA